MTNPAFRYLGIPPSVLKWRPKRPSRNTSIFLFVSISTTSLYTYDRLECRRLKQHYLNLVSHISQQPATNHVALETGADWFPRRVTVYGARVPEDVDVDRATQHFKKYVKPYLVAAAIDYTIVNGTSPGGLARLLVKQIQDRRVVEAAQQKDGFKEIEPSPGMPGYRDYKDRHDSLRGGTLIVGRPALKEYLWALRKGYLTRVPLSETSDVDRLKKELASEDVWKDVEGDEWRRRKEEEEMPEGLRGILSEQENESTEFEQPTAKPKSWFSFRSTPQLDHSSFPRKDNTNIEVVEPSLEASTTIPPQPPLLLVPFSHPIGIKWWPLKLFGFFNHRERVESGAKVALTLIAGTPYIRPLQPPTSNEGVTTYTDQPRMGWSIDFDTEMVNNSTGSEDLDFLVDCESHTRRSFATLPQTLDKARHEYLTVDVPHKLKITRDLVQQRREPTSDELKYTPPTEEEVFEERVKKEKKWRDDVQGWNLVRQSSGVAWSDSFRHCLQVFDTSNQTIETIKANLETKCNEDAGK